MATTHTLELAVDSRGVKAGLSDADRALDETTKKADRATKSVDKLGTKSKAAGKNMSAAFAATGGGLSVTHGLAGMASGFRSADSSMVAFAASQALLDMGRMAEDMKGVAGATGTATTMFSRLGAVMKAHPIMTIAALLAAAASAMAMFGGETSESADEMNRLADAMEKVRLGREASGLLGINQLSPAQQEQSNVRQTAEMFVNQGATYASLARALGRSPEELIRRQVMGGVNMPSQAPQKRVGDEMGMFHLEDIPYEERQVSKDAARAILRSIYGSITEEITGIQAKPATTGVPAVVPAVVPAAPSGGGFAGPYKSHHAGAFNPAAAGGGPFAWGGGGGGGGSGAGLSPQQLAGMPGTPNWNMAAFDQQAFGGIGQGVLIDEQRRAELVAAQQQSMAEANQHMQELIMQGEQFGQTIGDAFMQVATGTMTARDAMASLVQQFAQMASSSIFRQIGGAVAGSFGPTQTQATANVDPGPIPLNS